METMMHSWKVVPISEQQRLDVRPSDLVEGGDMRVCSTYRGGGGYDDFPKLAAARGLADHPSQADTQLVVQLRGCNLDCPYCYVTRAGVWGEPVRYTTDELAAAYARAAESHGANVFHLMGGAPALQLRHWPELLDALGGDVIFHSDLMLSESRYGERSLRELDRPNVLLAVSVKGLSPDEWARNTRKDMDPGLMRRNMLAVSELLPRDRWYLTFTNVDPDYRRAFMEEYGVDYSLNIDLIEYNALPRVDDVPWGGRRLLATDGRAA